jgi:hypothetical protein
VLTDVWAIDHESIHEMCLSYWATPTCEENEAFEGGRNPAMFPSNNHYSLTLILWMGQRNPINHQKDGWNPINQINHLSAGAGFLPSIMVLQSILSNCSQLHVGEYDRVQYNAT